MNSQKTLHRLTLFASIALLTFVFALPRTALAQEKSLYERLGG